MRRIVIHTMALRCETFEITKLTTTDYCEREADESPILTPSGSGWNGSGMHHIDAHLINNNRWLACVDGWVFC